MGDEYDMIGFDPRGAYVFRPGEFAIRSLFLCPSLPIRLCI